MNFPWIFDKNKVLPWHNFIKKFNPHLQDTQEIEPFYFEILLKAAKKWDKQNHKRITCETYIEILDYEGRIYPHDHCFICEVEIEEDIALMQAFKTVHPECIYTAPFKKDKFLQFINTKSTIHLEDYEVDYLYEVVMKGL